MCLLVVFTGCSLSGNITEINKKSVDINCGGDIITVSNPKKLDIKIGDNVKFKNLKIKKYAKK